MENAQKEAMYMAAATIIAMIILVGGEPWDELSQFNQSTTMQQWNTLLKGLKQDNQDNQDNYTQIPQEDQLIASLREQPDKEVNEVYDKFVHVFKGKKLAVPEQSLLISLLGEITTKKACETLMQILKDKGIDSPDVKFTVLHALDKFSPESWCEDCNTEFSPLFETAWVEIDDPTYLSAIAQVMAKIGRPESLALFTKTLTDAKNNERVAIVMEAMADFENPALIDTLVKNLHSSPSKNVQMASGYALANMGQMKAALMLFDWTKKANGEQIAWAQDWLAIAMSTTPNFAKWLEMNPKSTTVLIKVSAP